MNTTDEFTSTVSDILLEVISSYNNSSYGTTLMEMNSSYSDINSSFAPPTSPTSKFGSLGKYFYPVLATEMILSIICLILTIVVYSILPEFRSVHGKNLISLSSSLLTTFTFLTMDLLFRKRMPPSVCFPFALIIHVTFLATFFWTNVMAFDIWRSIANLRPKSGPSKYSNRYRNYAIYAWGATLVTALPAIVLDRTKVLPKQYSPNFGGRRCWLSGTKSVLIYFNAPVGIILLCNLTMFILTTWNLIILKKITERLPVQQQQQRFILYLKLFLVMGIIWTAEFLPWATGVYELYFLAGILNCSNGILLFIIFVCKKKILVQTLEKLGIRKKQEGENNTSSASNRTTSSRSSNRSTRV